MGTDKRKKSADKVIKNLDNQLKKGKISKKEYDKQMRSVQIGLQNYVMDEAREIANRAARAERARNEFNKYRK